MNNKTHRADHFIKTHRADHFIKRMANLMQILFSVKHSKNQGEKTNYLGET